MPVAEAMECLTLPAGLHLLQSFSVKTFLISLQIVFASGSKLVHAWQVILFEASIQYQFCLKIIFSNHLRKTWHQTSCVPIPSGYCDYVYWLVTILYSFKYIISFTFSIHLALFTKGLSACFKQKVALIALSPWYFLLFYFLQPFLQ